MNDEEFKAVALVVIGLMMVVAAYPIIMKYRGVVEPFSELGILGPNMRLGDYPKEIGVGQNLKLFIYLGNHEGGVNYYRVYAKLGDANSTVSDSIATDAPIIASWDIILPNGGNNTIPTNFSIPTAGPNQRIIFEQHIYDSESGNFVYHNRWTQLWMNVYRQGG